MGFWVFLMVDGFRDLSHMICFLKDRTLKTNRVGRRKFCRALFWVRSNLYIIGPRPGFLFG